MQPGDGGSHVRLRNLAIALPTCLALLFLAIGLILCINRRRIVSRLYHKYNEPRSKTRPYGSNLEAKHWSDSTFSPDMNTFASSVLPEVSTSPSNKPDPYRMLSRQQSTRALGTPKFPGPRQHLANRQCSTEQMHSSEKSYTAYRPRCPTPDTPLSRKDQLAHRSQLIQDTHVRLGSISPEPPLVESPQGVSEALRCLSGSATASEEPNRVQETIHRETKIKERPVSFSRPLSRGSHPSSPHARPVSPAGSIRLVDRTSKDVEMFKRAMSDRTGTRLDGAFMSEWQSGGGKRLTTT